MGKQSLTRLAAHINNYQIMQIELTRGYDYASFREDLRKFYWNTGVANRETGTAGKVARQVDIKNGFFCSVPHH